MKHILTLVVGILLSQHAILAQCVNKYVLAQTLNVRKSPAQNAEVIGAKSFGDMLLVDAGQVENGYIAIKEPDGSCARVVGYVWAAYLGETLPAAQPSAPSAPTRGGGGNCGPAGVTLHRGSRGGCYYYSGNSKVYVDRSCCQ